MAKNKTADVAKPAKEKKQRWYHQVAAAYRMTKEQDPALPWVLLAVFLGVLAALFAIAGLIVGNWFSVGHWMFTVLFAPFALLAAMFTLTRRAEAAAYKRISGQPGASRSALGTVRGGWTFEDEPVAMSPKTQDVVFRGSGRAGVILVSEGPSHRVKKMLDDERRKVARVAPNVPVTSIQVGDEADQVPLPRLAKTVKGLKKQLTRAEADVVAKRLRALGGMRMPIPKGIDPTRARPDRKGMRGR